MERCVAVLAACLVLYLSVSGVLGAAGDTGELCKTDGTCTDATDFCETNSTSNEKRCKTKVDSNCNPVDSCIMNAACTAVDQPCLCNDGYYKNADKTVCVAKVGTTCTAATTCADNSECPTSGDMMCTCKENYVVQRDMMGCLKKVGQDCTSGSECTKNAQCTPKTCMCEPGFEGDQYGACGIKSGEICSSDEQCVSYATCKDGIDGKKYCTCDDSKPANDMNTCGAGASAVVVSLFVLMAAFLTSRLL